MYAEIAVNVPVQGTFYYHIPVELAGKLKAGHLVRVSFGVAEQPGIVLALRDETPFAQTKPVLERLDPQPVVESVHIAVARWLSEKTLAPLGACLWTFLPPGIVGRSDVLVSLTAAGADPSEEASEQLDNAARQLLSLLARRGPLRGKQLNQAMRGKSWRRAVDALALRDLAVREPILTPPNVGPSKVRVARLAIPAEHIDAIAPRLGRESRRANVLEVLLASPKERPTVASVCLSAGCGEPVLQDMHASGDVIITPKRRWLELTTPTDQVRSQLDAGDFDRAKTQKAALEALVEAGGALPVGELSAGAATALIKKGILRREEQAAIIGLPRIYLTEDGEADHAAILPRLIAYRGGEKTLSVLRLLARENQSFKRLLSVFIGVENHVINI